MRDQELEDGKVSSGVDDGAKSALGFSTGTKSGRPGHATGMTCGCRLMWREWWS